MVFGHYSFSYVLLPKTPKPQKNHYFNTICFLLSLKLKKKAIVFKSKTDKSGYETKSETKGTIAAEDLPQTLVTANPLARIRVGKNSSFAR